MRLRKPQIGFEKPSRERGGEKKIWTEQTGGGLDLYTKLGVAEQEKLGVTEQGNWEKDLMRRLESQKRKGKICLKY